MLSIEELNQLNETETDEKLYEIYCKKGLLKKSDGTILSYNEFTARFFYCFIDRGALVRNHNKSYSNNLFDTEKFQNSLTMKKAFLYTLLALENNIYFSFDLVNKIHSIATNYVYTNHNYGRNYTSFFFSTYTEKQYQKIIKHNSCFCIHDNIPINIMLHQCTANNIRVNVFEYKEQDSLNILDRPKVCNISIRRYQNKIKILNNIKLNLSNNISINNLKHKFILDDANLLGIKEINKNTIENLIILQIASIIQGLSLIHLFARHNGRLFYALMLNYLLIKENLCPSNIFSIADMANYSLEEVVDLIIEGQLSYKQHFLKNERIDHSAPLLKLPNQISSEKKQKALNVIFKNQYQYMLDKHNIKDLSFNSLKKIASSNNRTVLETSTTLLHLYSLPTCNRYFLKRITYVINNINIFINYATAVDLKRICNKKYHLNFNQDLDLICSFLEAIHQYTPKSIDNIKDCINICLYLCDNNYDNLQKLLENNQVILNIFTDNISDINNFNIIKAITRVLQLKQDNHKLLKLIKYFLTTNVSLKLFSKEFEEYYNLRKFLKETYMVSKKSYGLINREKYKIDHNIQMLNSNSRNIIAFEKYKCLNLINLKKDIPLYNYLVSNEIDKIGSLESKVDII